MLSQGLNRALAVAALGLALLTITCDAKTRVTSQPFGKMPDGTAVEIFTLSPASV